MPVYLGKNMIAETFDGSKHFVNAPTLTHTKTDNMHSLTGTIPTSGMITPVFEAMGDYVTGDTISVNNVEYIVTKGNFESNDLVQAVIDIDNYKLSFSHSQDQTHVPTLAHTTPTQATHALVGTIPTTGIVTANFKPVASYEDGDSITVNGEPYSLLKGSFEQDIPTQVLLDVAAKTVTIGGSGGGGGMVQQLELPMSDKYGGTVTEWVEHALPAITRATSSKSLGMLIKDNSLHVIRAENNFPTILQEYDLSTGSLISEKEAPPLINQTSTVYGIETNLFISSNGDMYVLFFTQYTVSSMTYNRSVWKYNRLSNTFTHVWYDTVTSLKLHHNWSMHEISNNTFFVRVALVGNPPQYWLIASKSSGPYVPTPAVTNTSQKAIVQKIQDNKLRIIEQTGQAGLYRLYDIDVVKDALRMTFITEVTGFNLTTTNTPVRDKMVGLNINLSQPTLYEFDLNVPVSSTEKYPKMPYLTNALSTFELAYYNGNISGMVLNANNLYVRASLNISPAPPSERPLVAKLFKGDKYSAPFISAEKPIEVLPLTAPHQSTFTITNMQQTAVEDKEIHLGQYDLKGSATQLLVVKE